MSTRLKGWIAAALDQADNMETAALEIQDGMYLATAIGTQLDLLGRVYNVSRQGRSDTDYRKAIQAQASLAVNGTPDEIVTFMRVAYGVETTVTNEYPAAYFLEPETAITLEQLAVMSPAGVLGLPTAYATLENGEYETLEDGTLILMVEKFGDREYTVDSFDVAADTWQDTLSGPYDTLQDTLEI